jgi:hypothetical protein
LGAVWTGCSADACWGALVGGVGTAGAVLMLVLAPDIAVVIKASKCGDPICTIANRPRAMLKRARPQGVIGRHSINFRVDLDFFYNCAASRCQLR